PSWSSRGRLTGPTQSSRPRALLRKRKSPPRQKSPKKRRPRPKSPKKRRPRLKTLVRPARLPSRQRRQRRSNQKSTQRRNEQSCPARRAKNPADAYPAYSADRLPGRRKDHIAQ